MLLMKQWNKEADVGVDPDGMRQKWKVWWMQDVAMDGLDMDVFRRFECLS